MTKLYKCILVIIYICLSIILCQNKINAQSISYEQVAINHFVKELLVKDNEIEYLIFDGKIEEVPSLNYDFCTEKKNIDYVDTINIKSNDRIEVPYPLIKNFGLIKKIFVSGRKQAVISVFKPYHIDEATVVVVVSFISRKDILFYSISINADTNMVTSCCKKRFDS